MSELPSVSPTKLCPHCAVQTQTAGDFCPHCGKPYAAKARSSRRRTFAIGISLILFVAVGGAGVLVMQRLAEREATQEAEASAAAEAADEAERRARERAAAEQEAADAAERERRASLVEQLEESVMKDANEAVDDGFLEGPILSVSCTATGGGSTDDLVSLSTTYECFATYEENDDGTATGYVYSATANWSTGSYTWQLGQ